MTDELVLFDYVAGKIRVNPDLKPQTGDHYEVGARHFFTPNLQANITFYRAEIKNEIFFNQPSPSPMRTTQTLHQGVEIGGKADFFERLTLFGNYTYEKAIFHEGLFDGKDIPAVPRNKFNLGFRIHDVVPKVFSLRFTTMSEQVSLSATWATSSRSWKATIRLISGFRTHGNGLIAFSESITSRTRNTPSMV